MLQVAVVDDEQKVREQLAGYLQQYARENALPIGVRTFENGEEIVRDYRGEYDIILLDIDMPVLGGMTTAEQIRALDKDTVLVFITNMAQCAIQGYEVDALDFIIKPLTYNSFYMRFSRAVRRVNNREEKSVAIQTAGGLAILRSGDILWFETAGHRVLCHTRDGVLYINNSLRNIEKMMADKGDFARCSKSCLVNLCHVEAIREHTVLVGTAELEISRRRQAAFAEAALNYMGEIR